MQDGRADSWKEAVNLYLDEGFKESLLQQMGAMNMNLAQLSYDICNEGFKIRQEIAAGAYDIKETVKESSAEIAHSTTSKIDDLGQMTYAGMGALYQTQ